MCLSSQQPWGACSFLTLCLVITQVTEFVDLNVRMAAGADVLLRPRALQPQAGRAPLHSASWKLPLNHKFKVM